MLMALSNARKPLKEAPYVPRIGHPDSCLLIGKVNVFSKMFSQAR